MVSLDSKLTLRSETLSVTEILDLVAEKEDTDGDDDLD